MDGPTVVATAGLWRRRTQQLLTGDRLRAAYDAAVGRWPDRWQLLQYYLAEDDTQDSPQSDRDGGVEDEEQHYDEEEQPSEGLPHPHRQRWRQIEQQHQQRWKELELQHQQLWQELEDPGNEERVRMDKDHEEERRHLGQKHDQQRQSLLARHYQERSELHRQEDSAGRQLDELERAGDLQRVGRLVDLLCEELTGYHDLHWEGLTGDCKVKLEEFDLDNDMRWEEADFYHETEWEDLNRLRHMHNEQLTVLPKLYREGLDRSHGLQWLDLQHTLQQQWQELEQRHQRESLELEERFPSVRSGELDRLLEECSSRRHELQDELQKELDKELEEQLQEPLCLVTDRPPRAVGGEASGDQRPGSDLRPTPRTEACPARPAGKRRHQEPPAADAGQPPDAKRARPDVSDGQQ
ncbi:golgin subfamily A member 6-like protein 6 [Amphibalanus amphitrite]|uniref:golgin subfamily A member 6-like protein 6 n=1 Tax=Amphibalanus amphitrite TaxID=1232801 RepID=UPI001C91CB02|nr:golgin subfamily A member 6-like protein 6 [Amphibalanus amphitrite]